MKEFFRNIFGKSEGPSSEEITSEEDKRALGEEVSKILEDPNQVNRIDVGLGKKKDGENSEK